MVCGIYSITNKIDGKKYIGQSVDISKRFFQHKSELRSNTHPNNHLQHSWNRYGEENFLFEIITECTMDELDEFEKYYIDINNSMNPKFGYNFESGGNKNKSVSKETRKKMSDSLSGRRHPFYGKIKEDAPFYGYKHTEKTKKRIGDSNRGENHHNYGKPLPLTVKKR